MKHNWEYKRLGDVATYVNGYAFKPSDWLEIGYPIIRIQNLNNEDAEYNYSDGNIPAKYFVANGDLLISWSASLGAYIWHGDRAVLNQHIFKVVFDKTDILKRYLKYFVDFSLPLMATKTHGATMKHITKPRFDALPIPVPPMEVQERIVAELDKINETIEDCRELLRNLDALAQSLFYDFFGDPTTFHNRWEISTLGENCTFIGGGTPSKSNAVFYSGNIPWATVRDMSNFLLSSTELKITEEAIKLSATNLLPKGTIVISTHVGLGKICKLMQDTAINQDLKGVILNERLIDTFFVYWYLNMAPHIIANGRGATVKGVTLDFMRSLKIPVPPLELQEKFAERIEQIEEQKKIVENTIAELQTLLDSRMDYWFN